MTASHSPVTVLGLGPMGRALAAAFVRGGHPTTVWNRTRGKAALVSAPGANEAGTPARAVEASPLVVVCVIDHSAARAIVEPIAGRLAGRTLVNLTSDTPAHARELAEWAAALRIGYLDGAILTPVQTIGGPAASVLYSGPEAVYQRHRDTLAALGGTSYLGSDPGRAAAYDVALLDIFWTAMSGLVHGFALARAEGIAATEFAPFARGLGALLPGIADVFAKRIDEGRHPGDTSTVASAAAGMAHIVDTAEERGLDTTVLCAARALAERAVEAGQGNDGFSRLAELLTESTR